MKEKEREGGWTDRQERDWAVAVTFVFIDGRRREGGDHQVLLYNFCKGNMLRLKNKMFLAAQSQGRFYLTHWDALK